jgi:hypothetical protein
MVAKGRGWFGREAKKIGEVTACDNFPAALRWHWVPAVRR